MLSRMEVGKKGGEVNVDEISKIICEGIEQYNVLFCITSKFTKNEGDGTLYTRS